MTELKKSIVELTHCAGCQSCLRMDEKDEINQLEHFIARKDITEEIEALKKDAKRLDWLQLNFDSALTRQAIDEAIRIRAN